MKKINEKILKYLSGTMTEKEIEKFEEEIKVDISLSNECEDIKSILKGISIPEGIQLDERYFINLIPRIKEKLDSKKRNPLSRRISYAIPALIIIIVIVFFFPSNKEKTDEAYRLLTEEVINNIDNEEVAGKYLDYTLMQNLSYVGLNGEIDASIPSIIEMPSEYSTINNYEYYNEYSTYENYSDEELEKAYKYLSMLTL